MSYNLVQIKFKIVISLAKRMIRPNPFLHPKKSIEKIPKNAFSPFTAKFLKKKKENFIRSKNGTKGPTSVPNFFLSVLCARSYGDWSDLSFSPLPPALIDPPSPFLGTAKSHPSLTSSRNPSPLSPSNLLLNSIFHSSFQTKFSPLNARPMENNFPIVMKLPPYYVFSDSSKVFILGFFRLTWYLRRYSRKTDFHDY